MIQSPFTLLAKSALSISWRRFKFHHPLLFLPEYFPIPESRGLNGQVKPNACFFTLLYQGHLINMAQTLYRLPSLHYHDKEQPQPYSRDARIDGTARSREFDNQDLFLL